MYLGFNYDLARGIQDELFRWAEQQRNVKRVRHAARWQSKLPEAEWPRAKSDEVPLRFDPGSDEPSDELSGGLTDELRAS